MITSTRINSASFINNRIPSIQPFLLLLLLLLSITTTTIISFSSAEQIGSTLFSNKTLQQRVASSSHLANSVDYCAVHSEKDIVIFFGYSSQNKFTVVTFKNVSDTNTNDVIFDSVADDSNFALVSSKTLETAPSNLNILKTINLDVEQSSSNLTIAFFRNSPSILVVDPFVPSRTELFSPSSLSNSEVYDMFDDPQRLLSFYVVSIATSVRKVQVRRFSVTVESGGTSVSFQLEESIDSSSSVLSSSLVPKQNQTTVFFSQSKLSLLVFPENKQFLFEVSPTLKFIEMKSITSNSTLISEFSSSFSSFSHRHNRYSISLAFNPSSSSSVYHVIQHDSSSNTISNIVTSVSSISSITSMTSASNETHAMFLFSSSSEISSLIASINDPSVTTLHQQQQVLSRIKSASFSNNINGDTFVLGTSSVNNNEPILLRLAPTREFILAISNLTNSFDSTSYSASIQPRYFTVAISDIPFVRRSRFTKILKAEIRFDLSNYSRFEDRTGWKAKSSSGYYLLPNGDEENGVNFTIDSSSNQGKINGFTARTLAFRFPQFSEREIATLFSQNLSITVTSGIREDEVSQYQEDLEQSSSSSSQPNISINITTFYATSMQLPNPFKGDNDVAPTHVPQRDVQPVCNYYAPFVKTHLFIPTIFNAYEFENLKSAIVSSNDLSGAWVNMFREYRENSLGESYCYATDRLDPSKTFDVAANCKNNSKCDETTPISQLAFCGSAVSELNYTTEVCRLGPDLCNNHLTMNFSWRDPTATANQYYASLAPMNVTLQNGTVVEQLKLRSATGSNLRPYCMRLNERKISIVTRYEDLPPTTSSTTTTSTSTSTSTSTTTSTTTTISTSMPTGRLTTESTPTTSTLNNNITVPSTTLAAGRTSGASTTTSSSTTTTSITSSTTSEMPSSTTTISTTTTTEEQEPSSTATNTTTPSSTMTTEESSTTTTGDTAITSSSLTTSTLATTTTTSTPSTSSSSPSETPKPLLLLPRPKLQLQNQNLLINGDPLYFYQSSFISVSVQAVFENSTTATELGASQSSSSSSSSSIQTTRAFNSDKCKIHPSLDRAQYFSTEDQSLLEVWFRNWRVNRSYSVQKQRILLSSSSSSDSENQEQQQQQFFDIECDILQVDVAAFPDENRNKLLQLLYGNSVLDPLPPDESSSSWIPPSVTIDLILNESCFSDQIDLSQKQQQENRIAIQQSSKNDDLLLAVQVQVRAPKIRKTSSLASAAKSTEAASQSLSVIIAPFARSPTLAFHASRSGFILSRVECVKAGANDGDHIIPIFQHPTQARLPVDSTDWVSAYAGGAFFTPLVIFCIFLFIYTIGIIWTKIEVRKLINKNPDASSSSSSEKIINVESIQNNIFSKLRFPSVYIFVPIAFFTEFVSHQIFVTMQHGDAGQIAISSFMLVLIFAFACFVGWRCGKNGKYCSTTTNLLARLCKRKYLEAVEQSRVRDLLMNLKDDVQRKEEEGRIKKIMGRDYVKQMMGNEKTCGDQEKEKEQAFLEKLFIFLTGDDMKWIDCSRDKIAREDDNDEKTKRKSKIKKPKSNLRHLTFYDDATQSLLTFDKPSSTSSPQSNSRSASATNSGMGSQSNFLSQQTKNTVATAHLSSNDHDEDESSSIFDDEDFAFLSSSEQQSCDHHQNQNQNHNSTKPCTGFVRRYGFFFKEYKENASWFGAFELLFSLLIGLFEGSRESREACTASSIVVLILYLVYVVLICFLSQPFVAVGNFVFVLIMAVLQMFGIILSLIKQYDVALTISTIMNIIILIRVAIDIIIALIFLFRSIKERTVDSDKRKIVMRLKELGNGSETAMKTQRNQHREQQRHTPQTYSPASRSIPSPQDEEMELVQQHQHHHQLLDENDHTTTTVEVQGTEKQQQRQQKEMEEDILATLMGDANNDDNNNNNNNNYYYYNDNSSGDNPVATPSPIVVDLDLVLAENTAEEPAIDAVDDDDETFDIENLMKEIDEHQESENEQQLKQQQNITTSSKSEEVKPDQQNPLFTSSPSSSPSRGSPISKNIYDLDETSSSGPTIRSEGALRQRGASFFSAPTVQRVHNSNNNNLLVDEQYQQQDNAMVSRMREIQKKMKEQQTSRH